MCTSTTGAPDTNFSNRSGGSRYYSKNDANNMVTLVGEFLLEQHMSLVWETDSKYEECSKYVQEHRLTLAFEVVTSVLGDHGDVPKQPYLICKCIYLSLHL